MVLGGNAQRRTVPPVLRRDGVHAARNTLERHPQAVPLGIVRHLAPQPREGVADAVVIIRCRQHPWRAPLEQHQAGHLIGERRHNLVRAGARANHCNALAAVIDAVGPLLRVHGHPAVQLRAGELGDVGPVQLAKGAHDAAKVRTRSCPPPLRVIACHVRDSSSHIKLTSRVLNSMDSTMPARSATSRT